MDDEPARPSDALLADAVKFIDRARTVDLKAVSDRIKPPGIRYPDVWPGEHYRLLAAIVDVIRPRVVIEVGTAEGHSALALKQLLPSEGRVITFDIIPWSEYPGSVLTAADFADGRLEQRLGDLSAAAPFAEHAELLASADLLFVDAPKDGRFEPAFLAKLDSLVFRGRGLVFFDDIRVENMLQVWRSLRRPKLDMTSFGHWSGSGLVDWSVS